MSGTVLTTIGVALLAGTIGVAVGWLFGLHRIRVESQQYREHLEHFDRATAAANARTRSLRKTKRRVEELAATVSDLKTDLKDKERALSKFQDRVLDREATINSLRSRLYGARMSLSFLEEELEAQHRLPAVRSDMGDATDAASSSNAITITVDGELSASYRNLDAP